MANTLFHNRHLPALVPELQPSGRQGILLAGIGRTRQIFMLFAIYPHVRPGQAST
jgi:hypothetical protein